MKLEVLGPGCARCKTLAEHAQAAVNELDLVCQVEKVTDIEEISRRGVLMTPALLIDGQLKSVGRVPSISEIRTWLSQGRHPSARRQI